MKEPEANSRIIYFNDRPIGETHDICTAKRKEDQQKLYRLFNPVSGLKAYIYCQDLLVYADSGIIVTVGGKIDESSEDFEEYAANG